MQGQRFGEAPGECPARQRQIASRDGRTNSPRSHRREGSADDERADDIVNDIVVSLLEGRLERARVEDYVKRYVTAHYRMFPTDHATFAGRKLMSLDAKLYDDSARTLGDTVSRGLWD